jgi:cytoskeletal protein CcmA (bactofilin family)
MASPLSDSSARSGEAGKTEASTIGEDLVITGNVDSKGEIHLQGSVCGDVFCVALVLGENAKLEGNVRADDVVVKGQLIGSIRAMRVTLHATSHVEGDLYHQSLAMEQGAYFEGKSRRSADPLAESGPQSQLGGGERRNHRMAKAFIRSLPESD